MTTFLSYLFGGPSKFPDQQRSSHPQVSCQSDKTTHKYHGRVVETSSCGRFKVLDDGSVLLDLGVSDQQRRKAQAFWGKQANQSFVTSACAGLGSGLSGSYSNESGSVAWGAVAVALGGVALAGLWRGFQAWRQGTAWEDPTPKLQESRRACGDVQRDAFSKVLREDLKGKMLSPDEVEKLWEKQVLYYDDLTQRELMDVVPLFGSLVPGIQPSDRVIGEGMRRAQILDRIIKHCPLDGVAIHYARTRPGGLQADEKRVATQFEATQKKWIRVKEGQELQNQIWKVEHPEACSLFAWRSEIRQAKAEREKAKTEQDFWQAYHRVEELKPGVSASLSQGVQLIPKEDEKTFPFSDLP